ncbi:LOW QUALITY PROTEIN: hypothetical protein NLU13_9894 [Sarocladium strictum]|uniref:Uncharacterized protein n=1 Tax=Sarocladium strictum TaxID=5046 RepID=A0AA39G9C0_SARSR|nr:LOW QUALITY PROTEIN: hypothetical protein NLU13_9894 [Sarocladium strictum]
MAMGDGMYGAEDGDDNEDGDVDHKEESESVSDNPFNTDEDDDDDDVIITGFNTINPIITDMSEGGTPEAPILVDEPEHVATSEEAREQGDEGSEGSEEAASGEEESMFVDDDSPRYTPPGNLSEEIEQPDPRTPLPPELRLGPQPGDGAAGSEASPDGTNSESLFVSPRSHNWTVGATSPAGASERSNPLDAFDTPPQPGNAGSTPLGEEDSLFMEQSTSSPPQRSPEAPSTTSTASYGPHMFDSPPQNPRSQDIEGSTPGSNRSTSMNIETGRSNASPAPRTPMSRRRTAASGFVMSESPSEMLRNMQITRAASSTPRQSGSNQVDQNLGKEIIMRDHPIGARQRTRMLENLRGAPSGQGTVRMLTWKRLMRRVAQSDTGTKTMGDRIGMAMPAWARIDATGTWAD